MRARTLALLAAVTSGCAFPAAFECQKDADCRGGATCHVASSRCVAPPAPPPDAEIRSEASVDAEIVDAIPPDLGPEERFCAGLCQGQLVGPCEALVPIREPSFEHEEETWEFLLPGHRVDESLDGQAPSEGAWMAELRVDRRVTEAREFARVDQYLASEELPAGPYRLCFDWRIVSGLENCPGVNLPDHSVLVAERNVEDPAAPPVSAAVWTLGPAEWCPMAEAGRSFVTTDWQEKCADFDRPVPWLDPRIGFLTRGRTNIGDEKVHTFLVDNVRLQALECVRP